jgi:hypothetical protein
MMKVQKIRISIITAACIALIFSLSFNASAAQVRRNLQPVLLQKILTGAGLQADVVRLDREDGFVKGVSITDVQGSHVLISFPKGGFKKGVPFLLSIDGEERLVAVSEQGSLHFIDGALGFFIEGIDDFVECILNSVDDFLDDISDCGIEPFCYVGAAMGLAVEIPFCLFNIL